MTLLNPTHWRIHLLVAAVSVCSAQPRDEVIVDNVDFRHVEVHGAWRSTRDAPVALDPNAETMALVEPVSNQPYGFEYLDDGGSDKGEKRVTFLPHLARPGRYQVSMWYTAGPDRSNDVPVDIQNDHGVATVRIDQTKAGGAWHPLGSHVFTGNSRPGVTIRTDGTERRVIADAVRFKLESPLPGALPLVEKNEPSISLGTDPMLLVDDFAIAKTVGTRRVFTGANKHLSGQPILQADRAWEQASSFGSLATVIRDQQHGVFKMWYWPQRFLYAFATSQDGIAWSKPELGLTEWQGSTANNLVPGSFGKHLIVTLDENEADPAHRFKGVTDSRTVSQSRLLHSADGLQWEFYYEAKPVTYRAADFTNHVVWDPSKKAHLLFTRTDYGTTGGAEEIRGVRVMVNYNLKEDPAGWRTLNNWLLDRPGDRPTRRQIYFFVDQIHAGIHIALVAVYEHIGDLQEGDAADITTRHERDIVNLYVMTSRDGVEWSSDSIYAGQPLIDRGGTGAFDKDVIMPISFVTVGDEHYVYYNGWNERHQLANRPRVARAVGLARLPRDRFAGLAAEQEGTITTKRFRAGASELELNGDTGDGRIQVEVLDESGRPIPGYARADAISLERSNGVHLPVRWKANRFAALDGRTIQLRFHLTRAQIFAFGYQTQRP